MLKDCQKVADGPVKSVVQGNNAHLIAEAARLWIKPADIVMDVTYGSGAFWREYRPDDLICHDLAIDGVDFRHLPEPDSTIDVIALDSPYISQGGRDTSTIPAFQKAYGLHGAPKTPKGVQQLIQDGMLESSRKLVKNGILFVKVMDYISGGKFFQGHFQTVQAAHLMGFEQVDEFVHFSGTGPQPKKNLDGSDRRQVHSRRAHTFLLVFQLKGLKLA